MLQLSSSLINQPVLSLRTGSQIAVASNPVINPNNLKIEGWYCRDLYSKQLLILLAQDVREMIKQGFIINDHEALTDPAELVRLRKILDLQFELLNKPVISESKQKLGKISDYAADSQSLYIQKLYSTQSILKNFSGGNLSIDRGQIIEITNRKIVVKDPLQPTPVPTPSAAVKPNPAAQ